MQDGEDSLPRRQLWEGDRSRPERQDRAAVPSRFDTLDAAVQGTEDGLDGRFSIVAGRECGTDGEVFAAFISCAHDDCHNDATRPDDGRADRIEGDRRGPLERSLNSVDGRFADEAQACRCNGGAGGGSRAVLVIEAEGDLQCGSGAVWLLLDTDESCSVRDGSCKFSWADLYDRDDPPVDRHAEPGHREGLYVTYNLLGRLPRAGDHMDLRD